MFIQVSSEDDFPCALVMVGTIGLNNDKTIHVDKVKIEDTPIRKMKSTIILWYTKQYDEQMNIADLHSARLFMEKILNHLLLPNRHHPHLQYQPMILNQLSRDSLPKKPLGKSSLK